MKTLSLDAGKPGTFAPGLPVESQENVLSERLVHVGYHALDRSAAGTAMAASASASRSIAIPAVVMAVAQAAHRDAAHRQHSKHGDDERDDNRRRRPNQTHHRCASFLAV